MDDLDLGSKKPVEDLDPIPFDDEDEPAAGPDKPGQGGVSHSPLTLGGKPVAGKGAAPSRPAAPAPKPAAPAAKPQIRPQNAPSIGTAAKTAGKFASSEDRITGVKTFFTKLHPGALVFLDEQVNDWLAANPGVRIKLTNTTVGEVQAKKTEQNIIMTVWY